MPVRPRKRARPKVPVAAKATRGWSDAEWDEASARLQEDGILDADGLTGKGVALRERVEERTNAAACAPWRRLGAEKSERLRELGRGLRGLGRRGGRVPGRAFRRPAGLTCTDSDRLREQVMLPLSGT
ncbi:hypothetical protein [Amycolatopsis sp. GM8]|uniref:helix-turn-helix domain-containing protein n=1 Tax=Amycolatopsis sp. GM8 TaxID=2896530 RepID=UPI001F281A80|nr:hypothetical protein [Amycolatopsis sp. GM8]